MLPTVAIFVIVTTAFTLDTLALEICRLIFRCTEFVHGEDKGDIDQSCTIDCACCKDQICGPNGYFAEGNCYEGCIDGYKGARCYRKCRDARCAVCGNDASICLKCKNGYYLSPSKDCSSECLLQCKACTSSTNCTECKDDYYNANGSTDCRYSYCPQNCKCGNNLCLSCKDGYYDTSTHCDKNCPTNCITCSSLTSCDKCKDGYFNGHEYENTGLSFVSNCTNKCRDHCTICSSYNNCLQCESGKYGSNCQNNCSRGCIDNTCSINSGNCTCTETYSGTKCTECLAGRYGNFCEEHCSEYCKNKVCDKLTGYCTERCITSNITGNKCNECISGLQGNFCNITCPENCKDGKCDRRSGNCSVGCKTNFQDGKCDKCVDGKYGDICSLLCPKNCKDEKCGYSSGHCSECVGNFVGDKCESCKTGFFGNTCARNCSFGCYNNTCDIYTGKCVGGCENNYSGDKCCVENGFCDTCSSNTDCSKCKPGYYGRSCNKECSTNCLDSCEMKTGICNHCDKRFFGSFCNNSCPANCTNINERHCERSDGRCLSGCVDGLYGPTCNETCSSDCMDNLCFQDTGKCTKGCDSQRIDSKCPLSSAQTDTPSIAGPAAGGSVAIIVIIAVIIVAVYLYKKRRLVNSESKKKDAVTEGPEKKEQNVYENIGADNILVEDEAPNGSSVEGSYPQVDIDDLDIAERADSEEDTDTDYYNINIDGMRVKLERLLTYVTSEHIDLFENDFRNLPESCDLSEVCKFAKLPENIALNRYNGIYPFDHSRVTIPGQPQFFINACYIDGYSRKKAYIASLGPTRITTHQFLTFWRMVWHEKSDIIVMLTNLREPSGMKCEQYWPDGETEKHYGHVTVENRSVEEFAEYTVRTFTISKGKVHRNLTQLHYTAWPDKGVPSEVTSLIEFRQRFKAVPVLLDGPVIVHCSAGVGRTGTFIALDILTEEGKRERSVDVYSCVRRMREQRVNMVQTAEQYRFLHKTLVHTLTFESDAMTAEELQSVAFEADTTFTKLFQTLQTDVDIENKEEVAAKEENRKKYADKSRPHSDIPGNRGRVRLYLRRKAGSYDYVNAVFINSFRLKDLFIAAQSPLPGTVEDFLCMVFQQNSYCIVALEDPLQPLKKNDVGKYLPADNETYRCGVFTVTSSKCVTKPQYILKKLTIQHTEKGEEKDVFHFQYSQWVNGQMVADSARDFVHFVKDVEEYVKKNVGDTTNVVAHCLSGFERSGLFCAVYTLLEKLDAERQVSVMNVVRRVRAQRRHSVSSMEQLKFCYQCISAYLESYSTYSNFAV